VCAIFSRRAFSNHNSRDVECDVIVNKIAAYRAEMMETIRTVERAREYSKPLTRRYSRLATVDEFLRPGKLEEHRLAFKCVDS